jgi:hypothetical protein
MEYIVYLREFSSITSDEFSKAIKIACEKSDNENLAQQLISQLQYVDIITQRVQHLIDTHEKVMTLYIDDLFKESFLHLQYFQFSIVAFELFEAMQVTKFVLPDMNQKFLESETYNSLSAKRDCLASLSEKIKRSIKTNAGDVQLINIPALTARQINICKHLYTMESERLVLDWYINNPTGDFSDLIKFYQSWLRDHNSSIELFDNA